MKSLIFLFLSVFILVHCGSDSKDITSSTDGSESKNGNSQDAISSAEFMTVIHNAGDEENVQFGFKDDQIQGIKGKYIQPGECVRFHASDLSDLYISAGSSFWFLWKNLCGEKGAVPCQVGRYYIIDLGATFDDYTLYKVPGGGIAGSGKENCITITRSHSSSI